MFKFRAGDKVKTLPPLPNVTFKGGFLPSEMNQFVGNHFSIRKVNVNNTVYFHELDDWVWDATRLELLHRPLVVGDEVTFQSWIQAYKDMGVDVPTWKIHSILPSGNFILFGPGTGGGPGGIGYSPDLFVHADTLAIDKPVTPPKPRLEINSKPV